MTTEDPSGYGQQAPSGAGNKTALLMILTLVLGLAAGGLIAWLIFSSSSTKVTADYDVEVVCNYTADLLDTAEEDRTDLQNPYLWRLQAVAMLVAAAERADSSYDEFSEIGGGLMTAASAIEIDTMDEELNAIQDFCDSRD